MSTNNIVLLFDMNVLRTSAVSSTNLGSILMQAASLVLTCNILCGRVFLNGRGHVILLKIYIYILFFSTIILLKMKYTPAVRSNILSILIFASCVILRSRVLRVVDPQ